MAKAQFHKHQRVFVRSVGTWTEVEKIIPHWTKGLDEPLRITYDVGLGRDFVAEELEGDAAKPAAEVVDGGQWRLIRAIANAPKMTTLLRLLAEQATGAPDELGKLGREAAAILAEIDQDTPL
jgi:hypothetical protein